jgi:hypothetical protein
MHRMLSVGLFALVAAAGFIGATTQGFAAPAQAAPAQAAQPRTPGGSMPGHELVVYGDLAIFLGPGKPENCTLRNRYKRGEPVGFRIDALDLKGSRIAKDSELVVHLDYAGRKEDIKMRWRANATQPEREFWVAKWMVPADAPTGIVRYTVTAKDTHGRTGLFKPFEVDASQLTIVE